MSNASRKTRDAETRLKLWQVQGGRCAWCEAAITPKDVLDSTMVDLDHWVPLAHKACGARDTILNLRLMHRDCNHAKDSLCPLCDMDRFWLWKTLRESVS
jgi:CRISPR/Cas system Type II protein with McrA/HNH and RuvC-like nuclease domain